MRHDSDFTYKKEAHHDSGVCNHTLPGTDGRVGDIGIRGESIGFKVIDWVPVTTASKVRLRCTGSMQADASATILSFSLHHGVRPPK